LLITPGFDFGARIQASAQWPLLGLLAAYDYLPEHAELSGFSLFLVLSLSTGSRSERGADRAG
jgi:hypothetical protein